jgi:hypothetical protein
VLFLRSAQHRQRPSCPAIGLAAIQQGDRVLYRAAHTLLEELGDDADNRKEYADFSVRVHIPNLHSNPPLAWLLTTAVVPIPALSSSESSPNKDFRRSTFFIAFPLFRTGGTQNDGQSKAREADCGHGCSGDGRMRVSDAAAECLLGPHAGPF